MKNKIYFLNLASVAIFSSGCGGSGGAAINLNNISSTDIVGTWKVTYVSCNGTGITSAYIPSGNTLVYKFDGSNLSQTETSTSCSQTTQMPYNFDGAQMTIAAGSNYSVSCIPSSCSSNGMMPPSACGSVGVNTNLVTVSVTGINAGVMTTRESDSQASSVCSSYKGTIPFTFSMTKQ